MIVAYTSHVAYIKMKKIYLFTLFLFFITSVYAVNYYATNPNNCPNNYLAIFCSSPQLVCGVDGSSNRYCYDPSLLIPSSTVTTSDTDYTCSDATCAGGKILDCYSYDGTEPHCDTGTAFLCDRNATCYTDSYRTTNCTGSVWGQSKCGFCRSGYFNCFGDQICESTSVSDCDGSNNNHYTGCSVDATAVGTCTCDSLYFACDGSITDTDGCELVATALCNGGTGLTTLNQCNSTTTANCTAYGTKVNNRDCFNRDSDNNTITCNGVGGCNITIGSACSTSTGNWNSTCLWSAGLPYSGNCTSTLRLDCDNSDSDSNTATCNGGNGCEITVGGACTVGSLSGIYGSTCAGSAGDCQVTAQHHLTNQSAQGSSTHANLWTVQWGVGDIFNGTSAYRNMTIAINNSACIYWPDSGKYICSNTSNFFGYDCGAGNVAQGTYINGSLICVADATGGGSSLINVQPLYNDSTHQYLNMTMLNYSFGNWSLDKPNYISSANKSWFLTNFTVSNANLTYSVLTGIFSLARLDLAQFFNSLNWINDSTSNLINYYNKSVTNATIVDIVKLNITTHETTFKHGNTTAEIFGVVNNNTFLSNRSSANISCITGTCFINASFLASETDPSAIKNNSVANLLRLNTSNTSSLFYGNGTVWYTLADFINDTRGGNTTEEIQDSIGNVVSNTSYIIMGYNDASNLFYCEANLSNFNAKFNESSYALSLDANDLTNGTDATLGRLNVSNLTVMNITTPYAVSCDWKSNANGVWYCGTDATGGSSSVNNTHLNLTNLTLQNIISCNGANAIGTDSTGSVFCDIDDSGGSSGFSANQSLNTSSGVTFSSLNVTGKTNITGNLSAYYAFFENLTAPLSWVNLYNYPVACEANSAITQLGDSVICTDYWYNPGESASFLNVNLSVLNATNITVYNMTMPLFSSCDLKTDASGNFYCGVDATGAGGSSRGTVQPLYNDSNFDYLNMTMLNYSFGNWSLDKPNYLTMVNTSRFLTNGSDASFRNVNVSDLNVTGNITANNYLCLNVNCSRYIQSNFSDVRYMFLS